MVYNDVDGDGMYIPVNPPSREWSWCWVVVALELRPSQTTIAASDGSYQFNILAPYAGTYCMSIDPLVEPNTSILIPGGFTAPIGDEHEITLTEGQDMSDLFFGWMFQFGPHIGPANLEITNVALSTPPYRSMITWELKWRSQIWVPLLHPDTTWFYPHDGWGPPNPGGYEAIPTLAPGANHTVVFSPGVLYGTTWEPLRCGSW